VENLARLSESDESTCRFLKSINRKTDLNAKEREKGTPSSQWIAPKSNCCAFKLKKPSLETKKKDRRDIGGGGEKEPSPTNGFRECDPLLEEGNHFWVLRELTSEIGERLGGKRVLKNFTGHTYRGKAHSRRVFFWEEFGGKDTVQGRT